MHRQHEILLKHCPVRMPSGVFRPPDRADRHWRRNPNAAAAVRGRSRVRVSFEHAMPFGRYFLVIGPSLAAFLWFVSSYMEPDPPVRAKSQTTAQAAGPGTTAPGQAGKPVAPGQATAAAAVRVEPAANPPTTAQGAPSQGINETAAAETAGSAEATPPPVDAAQKHKKRKQVAQRRQRRNNYASTARRTPYYNAPYYAYAPPYARYQPYPYGQR